MVIVRVGGPLWLAIICTAWGVVAGCFAAISSRAAFLTLRMLLGIAEVSCWEGGHDRVGGLAGGWACPLNIVSMAVQPGRQQPV
jgi:hypothetical protein